jgi:uncharacterized protein (TIGR02145 family)
MKPLTLLSLIFLFTISLTAQEYLIDFESSGIASKIDTIIVKNTATGATVVLTGDQVLHLKSTLSKNDWEANNPNGALTLFPNPMEDYSTLEFETPETGSVDVDIFNGTGLKLARVQRLLPPGRHTYQVSGINTGIYLIRINAGDNVFVGKLVSNSTRGERPSLDYINSVVNENAADMLKTTESLNSLEFKPGDKLLFTLKSGDYSTTITAIPEQDKSITGNFYDCVDMDNNIYPVVEIGTQVWMAANLKTTKYNDGTAIPNVTTVQWASLPTPAYSWRKNDESFKNPYGALYNWHTVNTGKLCPSGWHVPSEDEWMALESYVGGNSVAGSRLKETGTNHWDSPNSWSDNSTGFSMVGGGYRNNDGGTDFFEFGRSGYLWAATEYDGIKARYRGFGVGFARIERGYSSKSTGFSVRCLLNNKGPVVNTSEASNITKTSATCQGLATCSTDSYITGRGFCWSTNPNPDITSSLTAGTPSPDGLFTAVLSTLQQNTVYYVRAYAEIDGRIIYGNIISFRTLQESGKLTDFDGNEYKTVTIGSQTWMAENLKTTHLRNGVVIPEAKKAGEWVTGISPAYSWHNNNMEVYKNPYGALYNWYAVNNENLCPTGWHAPSESEFKTLELALGGRAVAGGALKEAGTAHWSGPNTGATNSSGYTMLPGGYRTGGGSAGFYELGKNGYLWSSTGWQDQAEAYYWGFSKDDARTEQGISGMHTGFSVRCLKNDVDPVINLPVFTTDTVTRITTYSATVQATLLDDGGAPLTMKGFCWSTQENPDTSDFTLTVTGEPATMILDLKDLLTNTIYHVRAFGINSAGVGYANELVFKTQEIVYGSVTDKDGNQYKTVKIGTQNWMAENLKTTRFRDGNAIPYVSSDDAWSKTTTPAFVWYNNDGANKDIYGGYYNWYTVDQGNLCPLNWHVPTDNEWLTLVNYLGGNLVAGGKLKETGTTHWYNPNIGATDEVGFTALAAGDRLDFGNFLFHGEAGYWWTSTANDSIRAFANMMDHDFRMVFRNNYNKNIGMAVRCLEDKDMHGAKIPEVSTDTVFSVGKSSATVKGSLVNDGGALIKRMGFCWSKELNPDTLDSRQDIIPVSGIITASLSSLAPGTIYYVRSYAINCAGIGYGNVIAFETEHDGGNILTDIDGNEYDIVTIGTQTWMAENLKTTKLNDGTPIGAGNKSNWASFNSPGYCWFMDDSASYSNTYGALYNGFVVTSDKACPVGWHIAAKSEWDTLINYMGGKDVAAGKLKEAGTAHWLSPNAWADNSSGFTALPGSSRSSGGKGGEVGFTIPGYMGNWWTSTNSYPATLWVKAMFSDQAEVASGNGSMRIGNSIRCIMGESKPPVSTPRLVTCEIVNLTKTEASGGALITTDGDGYISSSGLCWSLESNPDTMDFRTNEGSQFEQFKSSLTGLIPDTVYHVRAYAVNQAGIAYGNEITFRTLPDITYGTVTDIVGNNYLTVKIGSQEWMAENLRTHYYSDATPIPYLPNDSAWAATVSGAVSYLPGEVELRNIYGGYYNFYAVQTDKLCPAGWRLPSDTDWEALVTSLGGQDVAGGKLKEIGTDHWASPNANATNEYGFSGRGAGARGTTGSYALIGNNEIYWSTSQPNTWSLSNSNGRLEHQIAFGENNGYHVRCTKDGAE